MLYEQGDALIGVMSRKKRSHGLLDSLSMLSRGTVTVSVSGYPLVSIRADDREVDVEVNGVTEAGLSLSKLVKLQEGNKNVPEASHSVAKDLSEIGWKLTMYEGGSALVTMGRGVSRLTGHVALNPLKAKRLLDALR
jgi:hypothetical protein